MSQSEMRLQTSALNNNQTRALSSCLVTGGAGFLGRNIAKALLSLGCQVTIFDRLALDFEHPNLRQIQGDISDKAAVNAACEGQDCVFHTAAIIELGGGKAVKAEYRQRSWQVNVEGTQHVIDACLAQGVKRLVYTSSNAVCFNGTPVTGLDSSSPYATRVYDMYTESKMAAEKRVLAANQAGLLTLAIRPSGIYGAESNVMLDKFVAEVSSGKLVSTLGNRNAVHENSFIDNLVHGHILAAERLVEGNRACGRGYFISDHEPQNYFEFFRPLIDGLGYRFPRFAMPMGLMMPVLELWQYLHFKFGLPEPVMRPKELDKVCVTHISNPEEARRDLDYEPPVSVAEAMAICLPYCQQLHQQLKNRA